MCERVCVPVLTAEVYVLCVTMFLGWVVPVAAFYLWPLPKPSDGFDAEQSNISINADDSSSVVKKRPMRQSPFMRRHPFVAASVRLLKAGFVDAYFWGCFTYLLTAVLYVYARFNPDYIAANRVCVRCA